MKATLSAKQTANALDALNAFWLAFYFKPCDVSETKVQKGLSALLGAFPGLFLEIISGEATAEAQAIFASFVEVGGIGKVRAYGIANGALKARGVIL